MYEFASTASLGLCLLESLWVNVFILLIYLLWRWVQSASSYAWHSLMWERYILIKNLRWCIGHGSEIDVFFSPPTLPAGTKISNLILPSNRGMLLKSEPQASLILVIPLANGPSTDKLWSHFDSKGVYSVKSGYKLARDISRLWTRLWGLVMSLNLSGLLCGALAILGKYFSFTSCACLNAIPSLSNLGRRGMSVDIWCRSCGSNFESSSHAMLYAPRLEMC